MTKSVSNFLSDELNTFIEYARSLGTVAARDYNSQDRSTELADLRTRLQGREEILARYMEVLEDARSGAVVRVEQQITRSIAEIEQIKGRIRSRKIVFNMPRYKSTSNPGSISPSPNRALVIPLD